MLAALLDFQLETLEPLQPEQDGVVVDVTGEPHELAGRAIDALDLASRTSGSESSCLH